MPSHVDARRLMPGPASHRRSGPQAFRKFQYPAAPLSPAQDEVVAQILAHHARQRVEREKPSAPPAPCHRPEVLEALLGPPAPGGGNRRASQRRAQARSQRKSTRNHRIESDRRHGRPDLRHRNGRRPHSTGRRSPRSAWSCSPPGPRPPAGHRPTAWAEPPPGLARTAARGQLAGPMAGQRRRRRRKGMDRPGTGTAGCRLPPWGLAHRSAAGLRPGHPPLLTLAAGPAASKDAGRSPKRDRPRRLRPP
jgi:hypothetical protein